MASAYAAVVSLIHLIDQIPTTLFSEKQMGEIKSLKEKACFIQGYLETTHSLIRDSNDLKRRIVDASYAAADVIESHIVNIMASEKSIKEKIISVIYYSIGIWIPRFDHVSGATQKIIQDMDFIAKEVMKAEALQPNNPTHVDHSLMRPHPTTIDHNIMVGFDDHLTRILDKLTGHQSTLQIISITGMGGIGKTTLAQNVYDNSLIKEHFDIRCWVTVSQLYNKKQMLLDLLHETGFTIDTDEQKDIDEQEDNEYHHLGEKQKLLDLLPETGVTIDTDEQKDIDEQEDNEYHHLGQILYQHLSGRRYLIIVDDLWNTDAWDKLKLFFPNAEGSRIMVTTRLKNVANYVDSSNLHEINLLDDNKSWSLLCQKVFGQEVCPCLELEEVGKKIAKNCQGLPLSIIVIGGLLVKSDMTLDYWEYVADNINKIISSEDSDCLDILLLSYRHLPIHLQPCFLYMGVYPEDQAIQVSELINLWVVEGFLKPNKLKTLEEVAEEYLKDLTERHLIMVSEWGSLGKMKTCCIHDLLRDLCLREAHKEKFILVKNLHECQDSTQLIIEHRIAVQDEMYDDPFHALQSTFLVRSLTCTSPLELSLVPNFKLLRVFNVLSGNQEFDINLLNLRCLRLSWEIPKSICLVHRLWNLQTLVIDETYCNKLLTLQIWKMPHLRHLISRAYICIPDPPQSGRIDDSVLKNLQTLSGIRNFKCIEVVVKRIPNVKKLVIEYDSSSGKTESDYHLDNIGRLHKLQSLNLKLEYNHGFNGTIIKNCEFPLSLKKLSLLGFGNYSMEDIITRIGWLPHLEKLKLEYVNTKKEWNPVEGQFLRLKVLKLIYFPNLVYWNAENTHFPCLEHLHLTHMYNLEIPSGIGEITTLQSITLKNCEASVVESAKNILEEQHSFGNEGFRLAYSGIVAYHHLTYENKN